MIKVTLYFEEGNKKGQRIEGFMTIHIHGFSKEDVVKELLPEFALDDWKIRSIETVEGVTEIDLT